MSSKQSVSYSEFKRIVDGRGWRIYYVTDLNEGQATSYLLISGDSTLQIYTKARDNDRTAFEQTRKSAAISISDFNEAISKIKFP